MYEIDKQIKLEKARALKLANDRTRGLLIPAEESRRALFDALRVIRQNVENVPARIGAEVAAESDPVKVIARMTEELRLALGTSADQIEAADAS